MKPNFTKAQLAKLQRLQKTIDQAIKTLDDLQGEISGNEDLHDWRESQGMIANVRVHLRDASQFNKTNII